MNVPRKDDRMVAVTAWLTDEVFGYDHWRAAQFAAGGDPEQRRPAVLLLFADERERD